MNHLNLKEFYDSDFKAQFLEFTKRYDEVYSDNYYNQAVMWLANYNFDEIYKFLAPTELKIPFNIKEFIDMSSLQLIIYQDICSKMIQLEDEKQSLRESLQDLLNKLNTCSG